MTQTTTPRLVSVRTRRALKAMAAKLEKYEKRIRSLEDDRLKLKAWAALLMFAGNSAAFFVGHFWPK